MATTSGWCFVRHDTYETIDVPESCVRPYVQTVLTVGEEAIPPDGDESDGFFLDDGVWTEYVIGNQPGVFIVYLDLTQFAQAAVTRGPGYRNGWAPNKIERGYRMIEISFDWPTDGGYESDLDHPHGPVGDKVPVRRADVIAELTADDIYAIATPLDQSINYSHARDSMQQLIDA